MRTIFVTSTLLILFSIACVCNAGPMAEDDFKAVLRSIRGKHLCKVCIPGRGIRVRTFLEKRCVPNRRIVRCIKRAVFPKLYKVKVEEGLRCSCNNSPRKMRPRRTRKPRPTFIIPTTEVPQVPEVPEVPDATSPTPLPSMIPIPSVPKIPIVESPSSVPSSIPVMESASPSMIPVQVECDTMQRSGGRGTMMLEVNLGQTSGTFPLTYMMFGIPDALEVFYEGELIYTTGGPVTGTDTVEIEFNGSSPSVIVIITAPNASTAWRLLIGCP